jgi:CheY-like chemotaxis protein
VNLLSLLTEINAIFSLETKKRNLKLIFNPDNLPDYYQISTDSDRLKQIFSNLLTNAIKFTQEGEIEFGIKSLEKEIIFYVKDSGIGIPPEAGESIFDRFIKLEKYKDKLYGGTGLGLAISKSLVEFLGGKIWYESELKTGTTFFFTHPASKGNETGLNIEENQDDSLLEIPDLTNKKILIAEDEDNNYRLLNCYLLPTNAEISWALNGKEAIEMALNNSFDIILMDIKMPVLNGIEAIRKIKKIKPEIPIIAQTAFAYKTDLSELSTIGVENYIVKPIKQADLLKIVKKLIG